MKKLVAIYARRSVEDNRSLSIDSQINDCISSLEKNEEYRTYIDNGVSAKNLDRPSFQQMMSDARDGIISRIVIKKYDRFSRDLRDSLNVFHELDRLHIGVTSIDENFDTSADVGKMMRNIVFNFAELERRRIADRVKDAYVARSSTTGFYQGGKMYYGYQSEQRIVNGVKGSVLVPDDRADVVKTAYRLYKDPNTSLSDVLLYFKNNGINVNRTAKSNMDRSYFSRILQSPLYVGADKEVYQYLASKGYEMIDDIEAFDGVHGCFRHKRADGSEYIKIGYHEGLVDSELWLEVQDKKSRNVRVPKNSGAKNSWLVGLAKCSHCHYALMIMYVWNATKTKQWRSFGDHGAYKTNGCLKKRLSIRPDEAEEIVFDAMKERLKTLIIAKTEIERPDSEIEGIKADIVRLDNEIRGLMEKLAMADDTLFGYIQNRVKIVHDKKSDLEEKLRVKSRKHKEINIVPIEEPMSRWDSLTTNEKHALAISMIDVVYISDEHGVDIRFSI